MKFPDNYPAWFRPELEKHNLKKSKDFRKKREDDDKYMHKV